jgi:hypothetical protein
MQIAPPPTMPFDGDYIGVSREVAGEGAECRGNSVPATLIVRNSVILGLWQGTVSSQGAIVMRNPYFSRVDAQVNPQGTITGQYKGSACTDTFIWRKQPG